MAEVDRIRWRCRRGIRELDELLLGFFEQAYHRSTDSEQLAFVRLLEYSDQAILEILMQRMVPTEPDIAHVAAKIRRTIVSSA